MKVLVQGKSCKGKTWPNVKQTEIWHAFEILIESKK